MFDPEFFPTPLPVIDQMGIDCYGKTVLEPSAGSGNIVNWLAANGAASVLACEKNDNLRRILSGRCELLAPDFFEVSAERVSHVQMIVMNPPFSNAAKHINHAWSIAPEGCEIIALCNYETVRKCDYTRDRESLTALIKEYGEALSLGQCFQDAERRTDVEVGLVRLFKPVVSGGMDFDGFYLDIEEEPPANGMLPYNEIRAIVNNYVGAVNCFDKVRAASEEMKQYTCTSFGDNIPFTFGSGFTFHVKNGDNGIMTKSTFAKAMQMQCWKFIFDRVNIGKYVTTGVMKDINKFIESRQNYPFTMRNVYRMLEVIVGTREHTMNRAIVEAVDNFTRHTDENRYGVEGWKTNAGHLLNRKFITPYIAESNYGRGLGIKWYQSNWEMMLDLVKALCFVTGRSFDEMPDVRMASVPLNADGEPTRTEPYYNISDYVGYNQFTPNVWYSWGFFDFKVFKKGTGHFKFKNEDDWGQLNRAYAKIKGQVLPEKLK